jgi:hypothetical protein
MGIAIALIGYLVLSRPVEGLETTVKIADENGAGKVPDGAKKVKYGAGERWAYKDVNPGDLVICSNAIFGDPAPGIGKACYAVTIAPDTAPAAASGMGMMSGPPCKASGITRGAWAHKGIKDASPERYKASKPIANSLTPEDCAEKCCSDNKCNAFTHVGYENACWLYYDDLKELEHDSLNGGFPTVKAAKVDRSGGLSDLTNSLSGGATQTMESIYGVLGSGLSTAAIVGIIIAVLAIGIPLAVYGYRFFGGRSLAASPMSVGNPVTRMSVPVAK